jgi:alpha-L-fucosidase
VNDRCGIPAHDFVTAEYEAASTPVRNKWEESRGLDPFSYGYNAATPDSSYMSGAEVVQTLVDVVSKNGNLLLGIGPKADGSIPAVMVDRLREVGSWLERNGESIYGTSYWDLAQAEQTNDEDLRFTVAPNRAFYVIDLKKPNQQLVVESPIPIRQGDQITLLGYDGGPLRWTERDGTVFIDVPDAAVASGRDAWVFRVDWQP